MVSPRVSDGKRTLQGRRHEATRVKPVLRRVIGQGAVANAVGARGGTPVPGVHRPRGRERIPVAGGDYRGRGPSSHHGADNAVGPYFFAAMDRRPACLSVSVNTTVFRSPLG